MYNFADLVSDLPVAPQRCSGAPTALRGIRVVDFSHFIAGPYATMMLADFGAEVLKIEAPGQGDDFRNYPPTDAEMPGLGASFFYANRNKKSLALDLKNADALAVVRELIVASDVLVENFSTGVMQRLGLDYESCKAWNPRLIYCSIPAYSREGEFSRRLGFDPIAQAESGFISMNGYSDRQGVRALSPVMDTGTALIACNTVLAALMARTHTGVGQYCEVALFDSALAMTGYAPMQYLFAQQEPQRNGNTSPDTSPSGVFECADSSFYINSGNDRIFRRLMVDVLQRQDVADDPRFVDRAGRMAHREALFCVLRAEFIAQPFAHWREKFLACGVPSGQVRTLAQALRSPEARDRGLITRIAHPVAGWVPNLTPPSRLSDTPVVDPVAAPTVGQHTEEVLQQVLGYDQRRLDALACAGVFGGPVVVGLEECPQSS